MSLSESYYSKFAAAYVRGVVTQRQGTDQPFDLKLSLQKKNLDELSVDEIDEILKTGKTMGLKLYRFKNIHDELPRVKKVLGFLKSVEMKNILDVGSGRGVFLWPCLNTFPWIEVTCIDILPHRVDMINTVRVGGIDNLVSLAGDICDTPIAEKSFDVVTMLEVLEHIPDTLSAIRAAVNIAKKYVVVSVPSGPDDNTEHIHLITKNMLTDIFSQAGCNRLHYDGVSGHLIMTAVI